MPAYIFGSREDHIVPWKSAYAATRLFKGPVRFCLSGSGHIAGVVNPPAAKKYAYWLNARTPKTPELAARLQPTQFGAAHNAGKCYTSRRRRANCIAVGAA